ncbi:Double-stranded RNA-binding protein 3 [Acorus gramineus]|uniref:Double-stranded RNA-binding protein 3 n=1 Tax=Acorus gramineus TaxID=55184 RepID=A0AAV9B243_ACOGR|nr:Double-stranded RNA-binding protein 3 [Acorus gramineus]
MYKNQLQELAQRSCFNLPSYACIREGPDHAPRFKASVNFNGEVFECPTYCSTLRQAEHAAAEVALNTLSTRCPSRSLTARVLDETGVYKNLLQETAHRAGLELPVYTTVRSGPGHLPVFTCTVELAGMSFHGEPSKTKKQAEKNAAMAAWSALKHFPDLGSMSQANKEGESSEEQEQVVVQRVLSNFKPKREPQQMKRRITLGHHKEVQNYPSSSNTATNTTQYIPQIRAFEHKKQSCFFPPPPQTGPKILQEEEQPLQIRSDEKDSKFSDLGSLYRLFDQRTHQTHIKTRPFVPPKPTHQALQSWQSILVPRAISSGGFHAPGIAPAVQIRSVIPVCAAPPPRPPSDPPKGPPPSQVEEDVSSADSKLGQLKL